MAIVVTSGIYTTSANTKSADLVSGTYQFIGKGKVTLIAKASATAPAITCLVGGIALVNDQKIPYTGTAGTISVNDNIITSQVMNGGRVELYIREITGGTPTVDYMLMFEPM
jgi:Tfp pilus assembly major pilin PilA